VQNPVFEAKDISRYPGTAVKHATFENHDLHLLEDVSSVVTPHELVEKLAKENPTGHLIVTGMNPIEVLDGARSFEPSSHLIEYDMGSFNFIFTDSESESYFTPTSATTAWLRSSSICASNGIVYHVVLLEYKLGHCVWHVFSGDAQEQEARTFSTHAYVRLPAVVSGTLCDEYIPAKLLSAIFDFVRRTPDLSTRNLATKVSQVANSVNPRTTARERWIALHVAELLAPRKDPIWYVRTGLWNMLYALSFQWHMLASLPDLFQYVDERKRTRTIHPTPGGGWSPGLTPKRKRQSIPNNPTMLQRLSAFTGSVFVFLLPKILIGEVLTHIVFKLHYLHWFKTIWRLAEVSWERFILTVSVVLVTSILPGSFVKIFTRLAGHFWRQLWLPGWVLWTFETLVTEFTGAPGYTWLYTKPGRGWFYQLYIWMVGAYTILPGLPIMWLFPWYFWTQTLWFLFPIFISLIILENLAVYLPTSLPISTAPSLEELKSWQIATLPWYYGMILALKLFKIVYNFANQYQIHQENKGQLDRIACMRAVVVKPASAVRRRVVDAPLPAVIVMPSRAVGTTVHGTLAVDPTGMNLADWREEVQKQYNLNPRAYPQLTPGMHCFWDCVASFGGTPHMWYSWWMAFSKRKPDPNETVFGPVTQAEMQEFANLSKFGIRFSGLTNEVWETAGSDRPTLHLRATNSVHRDMLHVELATTTPDNSPTSNLARILRTIRNLSPAWDAQILAQLNASPPGSDARPTPFLVGVAGTNDIPTTRQEIVNAMVASFSVTPILANFNQQEGFSFNTQQVYTAPYPQLYQYHPAPSAVRFAFTAPRKMWQWFRKIKTPKGAPLQLPGDCPHPLANPSMKFGANRAQVRDNANRNNLRPEPPRWTTLRNELAEKLSCYRNLLLPDVPLAEEVIMYTADVQRASRLVADLKAHPSVLEAFADKDSIRALDSIIDSYRHSKTSVTLPVRCYLGVSGCGKTTATINYLHTLPPDIRNQVRIVNHTESLRAQAKAKIDFDNFRGFNFPTSSSILIEPTTGPIVLDDAGQYWGGVLDLIILANPLVPEIVVNGDPAQGTCKFPIGGTQSEYDKSPIDAVAEHTTRYATRSHRAFRLLADTFGFYTTNRREGHITHTVSAKPGLPVTTASPRYVQVLASGGRYATTYQTVQGQDFDEECEIDMTGLEGAVSNRTAWVALTRSSWGAYLHMVAADPNSIIKQPPTASDLMNSLVYAMREGNSPTLSGPHWLTKAAFYSHLNDVMPKLTFFARFGASVPASAFDMVVGKSDSHKLVEPAPVEGELVATTLHAEGPRDNFIPEYHQRDKEWREANTKVGQTDQFKETCFVNPPVHKRSDNGTYKLSVEKRLKTQSADQNAARKRKCPRRDMIDEIDRLVVNWPKWTAEKHAEYIDTAVEEYCSKRTVKAVIQKLESHDPTRTGADIVISLKNQVIKKAEKKNKDAIPGQLIHEYDILTTLTDSAYALFIENELIPAFPSQFLFYRRMAPKEFVQAYRRTWRVGNGVYSSDVTRWDVGCDAGLLNFDEHLMRRCGFPEDYIAEYVWRRLNSKSQHGPMATMQNSGDRYTWVLNSIRRAVVTSIVCQVQQSDTVAINGDDAAIDRVCDALPFPDSPWEFKDQNGLTGEFSGFTLGLKEPVYDAAGIQYRTDILVSRDPSALDKWVNYLDLLSQADPSTPEAINVAYQAKQYMPPALFEEFVPQQFKSILSANSEDFSQVGEGFLSNHIKSNSAFQLLQSISTNLQYNLSFFFPMLA